MRRNVIENSVAMTAIGLVLMVAPAMADNIDLIKGKMTYEDYGGDDHFTQQLLTVKNNTAVTVTVFVECAFFKKDELLDAGGMATFGSLKSGQSGYDKLTGKGHADRTDCRISNAAEVDDRGVSTAIIPVK